jgi:hypothetical protein
MLDAVITASFISPRLSRRVRTAHTEMSEVPAWRRYPDMTGRTSLAARCNGSAASPGPVCLVAGSWRRYTPRANIVNSGESRSVPRGRGDSRPTATRAAPRRHIGRSGPETAWTNIHTRRATYLCASHPAPAGDCMENTAYWSASVT